MNIRNAKNSTGIIAGITGLLFALAVGTVRCGKVKERAITFIFSVAVAVLLGLFWLYPMLAGLMQCFGGSGC